MDKKTRRSLFSSVDAFGNPRWKPPALDDLTAELLEALPDRARQILAQVGAAPASSINLAKAGSGASAAAVIPAVPGQTVTSESWVPAPTVKEKRRLDVRSTSIAITLAFGIFLLALIPRLYFLFYVSDPQNAGSGWYGDTYHHWQIAYFTKEIGLSQGFRLWDLKGMEYFWGPIHPLMLAALFAVTGSTDIILTRLLSIVFGSISCVLVFYIGRRIWNLQTGLAAMFLAALNPVGIFNDASGMVEPIGITFLLAGLHFWPRRGWLAGVMWALAGMLRAEYLIFGAGLLAACVLTTRERSDQKIGLALGWILPVLAYMKFLLDKTGNAIYPIYWSFLGNALGEWQAKVSMGPEQTIGRNAFLVVLFLSIVGIVLTLWKKPRSYLLNLLGFGNLFFLGVFVGLTAYALSYKHYFWVVRIFVLPYMFLGLVLAALLFAKIPSRWPFFSRIGLGWLVALLVLLASQVAWIPIWHYYAPTKDVWQNEVAIAEEIASAYEGGTVLIPEGDPNLTYALVQFEGFTAHNLLGQKYDPFAYFINDPFLNWSESRDEIVNWLRREDIRLIVFYSSKETYQEMVNLEPGLFQFLKQTSLGALQVYKVTF